MTKQVPTKEEIKIKKDKIFNKIIKNLKAEETGKK